MIECELQAFLCALFCVSWFWRLWHWGIKELPYSSHAIIQQGPKKCEVGPRGKQDSTRNGLRTHRSCLQGDWVHLESVKNLVTVQTSLVLFYCHMCPKSIHKTTLNMVWNWLIKYPRSLRQMRLMWIPSSLWNHSINGVELQKHEHVSNCRSRAMNLKSELGKVSIYTP